MTVIDKATGDTTRRTTDGAHATPPEGQRATAMPLLVRLPRRLGQLYTGLALYGVSMALMVEAHLGSMPWDVFHQGFARLTGLSFGIVVNVVGLLALLAWIPLR